MPEGCLCRCVAAGENEILQIHPVSEQSSCKQFLTCLAVPNFHPVLSRQRIFPYKALIFLLIWYSVSTTLFQMIRSKIFISDCVVFFDTIATFIQNIAGLTILAGKNVAQVSNGISNPVVVGIIYWMIRILISGGCLVGVGILLAFIEIKIAGLYKKYCWDMITIMVILVSMAIAIYFADWIRTILPVNLLFLLLLVQVIYVVIRWYVKGWRETRGYY